MFLVPGPSRKALCCPAPRGRAFRAAPRPHTRDLGNVAAATDAPGDAGGRAGQLGGFPGKSAWVLSERGNKTQQVPTRCFGFIQMAFFCWKNVPFKKKNNFFF